mmetsp:Transcript_38427/g.98883  ORF Transcript_38427/g.98883 Transcript_38427/m.98883 type:complete len:213 (+) Transcript_38427:1040-1678(+)
MSLAPSSLRRGKSEMRTSMRAFFAFSATLFTSTVDDTVRRLTPKSFTHCSCAFDLNGLSKYTVFITIPNSKMARTFLSSMQWRAQPKVESKRTRKESTKGDRYEIYGRVSPHTLYHFFKASSACSASTTAKASSISSLSAISASSPSYLLSSVERACSPDSNSNALKPLTTTSSSVRGTTLLSDSGREGRSEFILCSMRSESSHMSEADRGR